MIQSYKNDNLGIQVVNLYFLICYIHHYLYRLHSVFLQHRFSRSVEIPVPPVEPIFIETPVPEAMEVQVPHMAPVDVQIPPVERMQIPVPHLESMEIQIPLVEETVPVPPVTILPPREEREVLLTEEGREQYTR